MSQINLEVAEAWINKDKINIKQFYLDNYFSEKVSQREKELWFETNMQAKESVRIMQKLYDEVNGKRV